MGCSHSVPDTHPRLFKARNLNDEDRSVNTVVLEVQSSKVIVHKERSKKVMATWPMACIRRYGCNQDNILFIEAGSGCDTGQGMYLFKCARTEQIFDLLKQSWETLQGQNSGSMLQQVPIPSYPTQTVVSTTSGSQQYYNTNRPNGTIPAVPNEANYTNDCVRLPSTSSAPQIPPVSPTTRGSTSSQHASTLASLPEGSTLHLNSGEQPFALQPAPASRKEMIIRRRINSDMPVASYSRTTDAVTMGSPRRRNSENGNYENNDVIGGSSGSFPRRNCVTYSKKKQQVTIDTSTSASPNPDAKTTSQNVHGSNNLSPDVLASGSRDMSLVSLRSDCELLLTPGSKSSGIGSLNGNGGSTNPPPRVPPPLTDPWKRQPHKYNRHRASPARTPQSARDYVNTTNASMDVSGTPLPATALGTMHFSFDFDHPCFPRPSRSAGIDRSRLNYVPIEVVKNGDIDSNCGTSSASSGIPGTPRTPKTPKTPMSNLQSTDYAIIDHNKTRALTNTHRAWQRERKSVRHNNPESAAINAV